VILRTCSEQGASVYEYARLAFTREVLDMFTHVNISGLIDWIDDAKFPVLVTEDINGLDLRNYSKQFDRGQFPLDTFLNLAVQLAEALSVVHHEQVIHKDLHPGNIVVNPQTLDLQMIDFGLASLLTREQPAIEAPENLEGVLAYLSPEQTGRMNRALDYRTDFYTLGVTLYEMLVGKLPFEAGDALAAVYAHMAVKQQSVDKLRPDIPSVVAAIIDKLLSKNAEDRYQSALGLKLDLERCKTEFVEKGEVSAFDIATQDISDRFRIPQTLYGRQSEISALLTHYAHAADGHPLLLAVGGYSGVGKSALIHEVHKPIAAHKGMFLSGKFDQFQRNTPYSAIKAALNCWIDQALQLPETALQNLRDLLNTGLSPNAGVLTEFMPEFEAVLGPQLSPVSLAPSETLARFNIVFLSFIKIITSEQPWVMFIDDIQWADAGTLSLIPELVASGRAEIYSAALKLLVMGYLFGLYSSFG
jgi:serine/threonine protein kinase